MTRERGRHDKLAKSAMRTQPRLVAMFVAAMVFASSSPAALAKPPMTPAGVAQKAFDEGQTLYDKGQYAEALTRFREAHAVTKSPNARLMVARCLLALGNTLEAYEELTATRTEAAALAEEQPKYEPARDSAAAELTKLEPKVAKVVVALSHPAGARVTLNGNELPAERLGVAILVLPGKVVVVVEPAKGAKIEREETAVGGQTKTIFVASGGDPAQIATKPPPPEASPPTGGGVRIVGFVVAGLGVVGLGLSGVTNSFAQNKYDKVLADCKGQRCADPGYADVIDEGKRFETISLGALVGGAAGVAAGALMIALGGPKAAKRPAARIEVGPGGALVQVGGSF